mmetsp:Transcript_3228/g.9460  ORF Transcript_3228/g.9460 Transcript_3228/m.9460 type:complete len:293 (-) Transcript_3228:8-886(-)
MIPRMIAAPLEIASSVKSSSSASSLWDTERPASVGMTRARTASRSRDDCALAPSALNVCVWFLMPPTKKHMPSTRRRLLRMLPRREPFTTSVRPSLSAKTERIISTALPNVAFSRPPMVSPTLMASSSVANPKTAARGRIARKLRAKMTSARPSKMAGARMATGTSVSRKESGCPRMCVQRLRKLSSNESGGPWPSMVLFMLRLYSISASRESRTPGWYAMEGRIMWSLFTWSYRPPLGQRVQKHPGPSVDAIEHHAGPGPRCGLRLVGCLCAQPGGPHGAPARCPTRLEQT